MRNKKQACPHCGGEVIFEEPERQVAIFKELIDALWRVYMYMENKNTYFFTRKDINHLLKTANENARFGDLMYFGDLIFKEKKGVYGIKKSECAQFFAGETAIPTIVWVKDKKIVTRRNLRKVDEIPGLVTLLNQDGEYVARYRKPQKLFN